MTVRAEIDGGPTGGGGKRIPLGVRLATPLLVLAVLAAVAVLAGATWLTNRHAEDQIDARVAGIAEVLRTSSFPLTDSVLRQIGDLSGAELLVTDLSGRVLASSRESVRDAFDPLTQGETDSLTTDGRTLAKRTVRLHRPADGGGPKRLHVFLDRTQYDDVWWSSFTPAILLGLLLVAGIVIAAWLTMRRVRRSIETLSREVQRLSDGTFAPITLPRQNDEIRDIATAVADAAAALERYQNELIQIERARTVAVLGAGLAHEMRNAVTGCRLALDLLEEELGPQEGGENLSVARRQLAAIESRLTELLQLGREQREDARRVVDLRPVVTECVSLLSPAARHLGLSVTQRPSAGPAMVFAEEDGLRQIVTNLVKNAIEAAARQDGRQRQPAVVVVAFGHDEDVVSLSVSNPSDVPPLDDALELFATSKPEGVGLGLSVVDRLAKSYGGSLSWEFTHGTVTFECRLPPAGQSTDCSVHGCRSVTSQ